MQLDHRQKATVIAALRFWQRTDSAASEPENDIATNGDEFDALQTAEIDVLIEEINFDSPDAQPVAAGLAGALMPSAMAAIKSLQERVAALEKSSAATLDGVSSCFFTVRERLTKLELRALQEESAWADKAAELAKKTV